jgi:hypothetical protein
MGVNQFDGGRAPVCRRENVFLKVRDKRSELDYPRRSAPARCCGFPLIFASSIFLLNCRYEVSPSASKIADASQLTFGNSLGDTFNARLSRFRLVVSRWFALVPLFFAIEREKESAVKSFRFRLDFRNFVFLRRVLVADVFFITYGGIPTPIAYFLLFLICSIVGFFSGIFAAAFSIVLKRFGITAFCSRRFCGRQGIFAI